MVENLTLLRLLNSRWRSLAMVRKASLPSIRSHGIRGSGSWMGLRLAADCAECRRMVKNTSLCFSIVANTFKRTMAVKKGCYRLGFIM